MGTTVWPSEYVERRTRDHQVEDDNGREDEGANHAPQCGRGQEVIKARLQVRASLGRSLGQ